MEIWDIVLETAGQTKSLPDMIIEAQGRVTLAQTCAAPLVLTFHARRLNGKKGMRVFFGETDEDNRFIWGIGGWENQDCILDKRSRGRGSCLTQSSFAMEDGHDYLLRLELNGRTINNYIDGVLMNHVEDVWPCTDALYHTASLDTAKGDVIVKAVNVRSEPVEVSIQLDNMGDADLEGTVEFMAGHHLTAENTFDDPECIMPKTCPFSSPNSTFSYVFPARSVTIFRLRKTDPSDKRGTP
jgi:alpha-L-arabinofuranosidase